MAFRKLSYQIAAGTAGSRTDFPSRCVGNNAHQVLKRVPGGLWLSCSLEYQFLAQPLIPETAQNWYLKEKKRNEQDMYEASWSLPIVTHVLLNNPSHNTLFFIIPYHSTSNLGLGCTMWIPQLWIVRKCGVIASQEKWASCGLICSPWRTWRE